MELVKQQATNKAPADWFTGDVWWASSTPARSRPGWQDRAGLGVDHGHHEQRGSGRVRSCDPANTAPTTLRTGAPFRPPTFDEIRRAGRPRTPSCVRVSRTFSAVDTASGRLAAPDMRTVSTPTLNEIRRAGGLVTVEGGSAQAIQTVATGAGLSALLIQGTKHTSTDPVRSPAGWLRWRLAYWRGPDGTVLPSRRQQLVAADEARLRRNAADLDVIYCRIPIEEEAT
jgi:hypothetical protein